MFYPRFTMILKNLPVGKMQNLRSITDMRHHFKLVGSHYQGVPPLPPPVPPSLPLDEDYQHYHQHKQHHKRNRERQQENWSHRTHVRYTLPMLGLLGLSGFRSSDSEKDRLELTDEEKMKKMSPAELLIAKGVLSMLDQEYTRADMFFHQALELAQVEKNETQEILILNLLASTYFESGQFEPAEKLFIDIMKRLMAQNEDPTDLAILELSLKLASIYSENPASREKATRGFKFVIESLIVKLQDLLNDSGELEDINDDISDQKKDELALLGWSYDWFAKHLLNLRDYRTAVTLLKRAMNISSKILGPLHDQTLILLNDIGTTMAMSNEPEEGRQYLQRAVEGAIKSQSKELASFYVNLGLVNLKLKKLDEAKRYCQYSSELASKNPDHHNSSEVIQLSTTCLKEIKRLAETSAKRKLVFKCETGNQNWSTEAGALI